MSRFLTVTDNLWMLWCIWMAYIIVELGILVTIILTLASKHGAVAIDQYYKE